MSGSHQPSLADLVCRDGVQSLLHQRAAATTRERFGRRVFVRAVVEISNYCRQNCHYCGMRRDNRSLDRHRRAVEGLGELLLHRLPASVTDVYLQAGEDVVAAREIALPLIRTLRRQTRLGITVGLGTLPRELCAELAAAGASYYVLKFESAHPARYELMEGPGSLHARLDQIRWLASNGWHVSSGFIAGLPGEGPEDCLASCRLADSLPVDGCGVSPFVPGEATPFAGAPEGDVNLALNSMALLRLMRPEWIIPAVSALNICQPGLGYGRGLRAGANLVTMNLTPSALRGDFLLYKRDRFIMSEERILTALEQEGLEASPVGLVAHLRGRAAGRPTVVGDI